MCEYAPGKRKVQRHEQTGPVNGVEPQDVFADQVHVGATNKYIEVTEPFKLARDESNRARLGAILNTCAQAIRVTLEWLYPYMPESAVEGLAALGLDEPEPGSLFERTAWGNLPAGTKIEKASPLFPRKE